MLMLKDVQSWAKSPLNQSLEDYSEDYYRNIHESLYKETAFEPLTDVQRLTLLYLTVIVAIFATVGNVFVLYVNFVRFVFCN